MAQFRPRKHRGSATWAKVKRDYLSGIPARVVAERHDVGLSNLKRKAREEGWRRCHHALELEAEQAAAFGDASADVAVAVVVETPAPEPAEPVTPEIAFEAAVDKAAVALAAGRSAEATSLLKAARDLLQLLGPNGLHPPPPPPTEADMKRRWQEMLYSEEGRAQVRKAAEHLAENMMSLPAGTPGAHGWFVYDWRRRTLGQAVADQDRAAATGMGFGDAYWRPDGTMLTRAEYDEKERLRWEKEARERGWPAP